MKWKQSSKLLTFLLIGAVIFLYIEFLYSTPSPVTKDAPLPDGLHPEVAEKAEELVQKAADKGIVIVITDDFRSFEEQEQLYEKGRTADGKVVTHAKGGESFHNFGLAIDFALQSGNGQTLWDMDYDGNGNSQSDWMEVVSIAKSLGFEWGGDWIRFKDYPHLQMNFGLSIRDLQNGERPPGQTATAGNG
ncbi:M15 family metallopeptidase [Mesobacillus zeae]|uniref:M15 family peptidase n=1 Tax=Mesobacillus zeae TaxID=1917180 RepID=A0A398BDR8_9BACI|nr:M15 family metallopeptidase [Mesobacillus zeae]RID87764.1 M15 family peptidase [Mesobacillus zeae]